MRFSTLVACLSATAAIAAPARMDKQTKRQALNPTDLLNSITSELTSTTSSIQDTASQLTDALGLGSVTGGVTGGASGGAHAGTSQSVNLDTVTDLLDSIVGQVTDLQSTLEGLTGTATTVGGDVASVSPFSCLRALNAPAALSADSPHPPYLSHFLSPRVHRPGRRGGRARSVGRRNSRGHRHSHFGRCPRSRSHYWRF